MVVQPSTRRSALVARMRSGTRRLLAVPHAKIKIAGAVALVLVAAIVATPLLSRAMTLTSIVIDGVISDWNPVMSDPQNCLFDSTSNADADAATLSGAGGYRDIDKVYWTWDSTNLYVLIKVVDSVKNPTDFLVYLDTNNDGQLTPTDKVVDYSFSQVAGNPDTQFADAAAIFPYGGGATLATEAIAPDGSSQTYIPKVSQDVVIWKSANSDKGNPDNTSTLHAWSGCGKRWVPNGNRTYFECRVRWSDLGLSAGSPLRIKVSDANPGSKPNDNTGPVLSGFTKLSLTADSQASVAPSKDTTFTHTLVMSGNTTDVVTLVPHTVHGWPVKVYLGGSLVSTLAMSATSSSNDTRTVQLVVTAPATATVGAAEDVYLTATSGRDPTVQSTVHDQVYPGLLTVYPDQSSTIATGTSVDYTHYVSNLSTRTLTVDLAGYSHTPWAVSVLDGGGAATNTVTLAPGALVPVTLRVNCPAGAVLGSQDVSELRATAREMPGYTDTAQDVSTVRPRVEISPDASLTCNAGEVVTFRQTVTNNGMAADTINLSSSAPSTWTVTISDSTGVGSISSVALAAHASTTIYTRVAIPFDAGAGSSTATITARSGVNSAYSDTATDRITITRMAAYSDPGFSVPRSTFTLGDKVYLQAGGLLTQTSAYFKVFNPSGTVVLGASGVASSTAVSDGLTSTAMATTESSVVGTYTAYVYDGSTNATIASVPFAVVYRASIADLFTSPIATPNETITLAANFSNRNSIPITGSSVAYTVWYDTNADGVLDAGDTWYDSAGVARPYSGTGSMTTHSTSLSVAATGTASDSWGLTNTNFPLAGTYRVTAIWTTSGGQQIDSRTSAFYSPGGPWPGLSITKRLSAGQTSIVASGDPVSFDILVTNTGDTTLATVPLRDTYDPSDFAYVSAVPAPGSTAVGTLSWPDVTTSLSDVAPGNTATVTVVLRASRGGSLVNSAISTASADSSGVVLPVAQSSVGVVCDSPASGVMAVNSGAQVTTSTAVSVDSTVTNAATMRIDAGTGWSDWVPFSQHVPATLSSGDGTKTVTVQYQSALGQVLTLTDTILLDATAPVTTAIASPSALSSATISVTLSVAETGTAPATTYAIVDGGAPGVYSLPIAFSIEGTHVVQYWSVDGAGNAESPRSITVQVDKTGPLFSIDGIPTSPTDAPVTPSIVTTEAGYSTSATVDGAPYAFPSAIATEGVHTLAVTLTDPAGNSTTHSVTFTIDLTPPTTSASPAAATYGSATDVALSATDTLSGVDATYYILDGGTQATYGTPIHLATDGAHTIEYWSVDAAGNIEGHHTGTWTIDTTGPDFSVSGIPGAPTSDTVTPSIVTGEPSYTTTVTLDGNPFPWPGSVTEEGTHTLEFTLTDPVGNSTSHSYTFTIDKTPPVTTAHTTPSSPSSATVSVTLEATDNVSGVDATYYRLDSGAWQPYSGAFDVSGDGTHTVEFYSVDKAGNAESPKSTEVVVDTQAPVTTLVAVPSSPSSSTISATLYSSDNVSGVAATFYRVDLGGWQPYLGAFDVSGDGTHTVDYYSIDVAGNSEVPGSSTLVVDTQAPTTTATAPTGWQDSAASVTLDATDDVSGVAVTLYSINGGSPQPYVSPLTISAEGTTTVTYFSVDAVGNAETPKSVDVFVDTTPPTSTDDAPSGLQGHAVSVHLWATDALSGVSAIRYSVGGGAETTYTGPIDVSADGTTTITYYAIDNAGNAETPHDAVVKIDTNLPSITITGVSDGGAYNHTVNPGYSCSDPAASLEATLDTASGFASGDPVSAEGVHTLTVKATNTLGLSVDKSVTFTIDLTPPDVVVTGVEDGHVYGAAVSPDAYSHDATAKLTATLDGADFDLGSSVATEGVHELVVTATDPAGNTTSDTITFTVDRTPPTTTDDAPGSVVAQSPVTLTLTATDTVSGVAHTFYSVDGGAETTYTGPIDVSAEGTTTIRYYSVDKAGNVESQHEAVVRIDTTAPALSISTTPLVPDGANGWFVTWPLVGISANEPADIEYSTVASSGPWGVYSAPFLLAAQGTTTVWARGTDLLGNLSAPVSCNVRVDTEKPVTSDAPSSRLASAPVSVTLDATDLTSGVAQTFYSLNGGAETTYTGAFDITAEGENHLVFYSVDQAGNVESSHADTITLDLTAPDIVVAGVEDGHTYRTAVTPIPSSTDPTAHFVGTLNGRDFNPGDETTGDGEYTLVFTAIDPVGNTRSVTIHFVIDTTPPLTKDDAPSSVTSHTVNVSLDATDSLSGVWHTFWSLDDSELTTYTGPIPVSKDGTSTLKYFSIDNAGNVETSHTATVVLDLTGPSGTMAIDQGASVTAIRAASVDSTVTGATKMRITSDGVVGPWISYADSAPVTLSPGDGTKTVVVDYSDDAGNTLTLTDTIVLDTTAPAITVTGVKDGGSYNSTRTPDVTCDDPDATLEVTVDGAPWSPGGEIFAEGAHHLVAVARDPLGNESTVTIDFTIDLTAPDVVVDGVADGGSYSSAVSPTVWSHDSSAEVTATLNGADFHSGTLVSAPGSYELVGTATDASGNSSTKTVSFTITSPGPTGPAAPRITSATGVVSGITVLWEGVTEPGLTGYNVYRATDAAGPWTLIGTTVGGVTTYVDGTVLSDVTYFYRVTAVVGGPQESDPSDTVSASLTPSAVRVYGTNRYYTAVDAVDQVFKTAPVVVIATGQNYPDSLSIASLAGYYHAPLLLVKKNEIPGSVIAELRKLHTRRVIINGGPAAVSDKVATRFKRLGFKVQRVYGPNRYVTAQQVAVELARRKKSGYSKTVYIARGNTYQDALAICPTAYRTQTPILLSPPDKMQSSTYTLIRKLRFKRVVIIGGTRDVSSSIEAKLRRSGLQVSRVGGSNVYETSHRAVSYQIDNGFVSGHVFYLATGQNFPDAMAGGIVAGEANAVLMITTAPNLHAQAEQTIRERRTWIRELRVLGGPSAVSDAVLARARAVLQAP